MGSIKLIFIIELKLCYLNNVLPCFRNSNKHSKVRTSLIQKLAVPKCFSSYTNFDIFKLYLFARTNASNITKANDFPYAFIGLNLLILSNVKVSLENRVMTKIFSNQTEFKFEVSKKTKNK